ncbi:MAG: hypothetical protein ACRD2P_09920 [Terriglobia bacterium]
MSEPRTGVRNFGFCLVILLGSAAWCFSQSAQPAAAPASSESSATSALEAQIMALRSAMTGMQSRMNRMETETQSLRAELRDTQTRLALSRQDPPAPAVAASRPASPALQSTGSPATNPTGSQAAAITSAGSSTNSAQRRLSDIEEEQQLLEGKVDGQYQTKVESASKYRVRLSGIALLNLFTNRGSVDNQDIPGVAVAPAPLDSNAVFGASVRQSMLGLEVFGPDVAGARTYGEIQTDFLGGFPNDLNGSATGILRIRTAKVEMDWRNTSLVAGQDGIFFSPLSPTSFASLAAPAFSYSGNLWSWVPQIRVEHRFDLSDTSGLILQAGILDPLTGEPPEYSAYRTAQAGERSGQPAYASRIAWTGLAFGRPVTVGVGGYYSRENWGFGRNVNGWAGMADLDVPLGRWFTFSSELYRGQAIGGLGAGIGRSVLYNGPLTDPATSVLGLNTAGGWAQLKFSPTERLEFNGAFGEDNPFATDLRRFSGARSYFDASTDKNQSAFVNSIFHLRSNLLLSLEYRRIWTSDVDEAPYRADQINLGIGVLF